MNKLLFFIFTIVISASSQAHAEVIKYTDAKGYTFFVDSIDKVPTEYKDQVKNLENKHTVSRVKPGHVEPSKKSDRYDKRSDDNKSGKLEIFVTDWCGYCRALEADLKKARIAHIKYNIETSAVGRRIYQQLGGGGIPLIRVNGKKIFRGYSNLAPIIDELN